MKIREEVETVIKHYRSAAIAIAAVSFVIGALLL